MSEHKEMTIIVHKKRKHRSQSDEPRQREEESVSEHAGHTPEEMAEEIERLRRENRGLREILKRGWTLCAWPKDDDGATSYFEMEDMAGMHIATTQDDTKDGCIDAALRDIGEKE